jgi:tetratricopeptide (TPR) repeat protein
MSQLRISKFIEPEHQKNKSRLRSFKKEIELNQSPKKKSSPSINKSFACYNVSTKIFKNNDSFSKDHSRTLSIGNTTPMSQRNTSVRMSVLNSSGKLSNGHPGPKEFEESKLIKIKKQLISDWTEKVRSDISSGNYELALINLKKIFKEDPNNLKALYSRAQCYLGMKQYKLAIPDLLTIIQDHPTYNKNIYIEIANCFIESKDYTTAIRQITRGLVKFPKFAEGYISRGILYNQTKKWDKAISDFYEAHSLSPLEGAGYLGQADSFLGMNDIKNALKTLDQCLKFPSIVPQALLKIGKIYFETQNYEKALENLNKLVEIEPNNAEAHYFRAFSLLGQDNLINASIALEQVIKYDSSKKLTGHALYNLGAIKIKQRDFYGAHFTFQRAVEIGLEIDEQKILRAYVEAILCLMKRKFKEGIVMLSKIIKKKNMLIQEYLGNCYAYRAYAYASLENHEKAVKDLNLTKKFQDLDNSSEYNFMISQAILFGVSEIGLELLSKCSELFPRNIEPLCYKSAIYFQMALNEKNSNLAVKSKEILDGAIKMRDSESDLYFFRGIVLYYIGKPIDAVYDFEQAIEKAEDNIPNHFLARGLCSAKLQMYKEAIQDFSIAIQLDEKLADAYLYRGKCALMIDDSNLARRDFQQLLLIRPNDTFATSNDQNFDFETEEGILSCFSLKTVKCKPETPWLNRVKGAIQFTEEIQDIESESASEEVDIKLEFSDIFSEKSFRKFKSLDILKKSPVLKLETQDSDSSLSEILDDIEDF